MIFGRKAILQRFVIGEASGKIVGKIVGDVKPCHLRPQMVNVAPYAHVQFGLADLDRPGWMTSQEPPVHGPCRIPKRTPFAKSLRKAQRATGAPTVPRNLQRPGSGDDHPKTIPADDRMLGIASQGLSLPPSVSGASSLMSVIAAPSGTSPAIDASLSTTTISSLLG